MIRATINGGPVIEDPSNQPGIAEADLEATFQQIAGSRGYVSNLMQTLALAQDGLRPFSQLGQYCRYGSLLTEKQRELVMAVALRDVHYGWSHHAPLARAAGIAEEQLALIREGRTPRDLDANDYALCDYAFEIIAGRRVPPRVAEALHRHFKPRQIVDIALLTSYYMAVAALVIGLDVELEPPETLQLEQAWQARLNLQPEPEPAADSAAAVDGKDGAGSVA